MALNNNLAKNPPVNKDLQSTTFQVNGMAVTLTPAIVRNYLVSGDKEKVSMQEVSMFINLCKFSGLNPWLKEAYCIKYGNEPATMVIGKEAFLKRANRNPVYDGSDSGIIVSDTETGEVSYRVGTFYAPTEQVIGGWAEVYRKDRAHSTRVEVGFEEYAAKKKDGTLNSQWSKKPATMIRKVAQVQALRESFPEDLGGLYTAEEQGYEETPPALGEIPLEPAQGPETEPKAPAPDVKAALFGDE